MFANRSNAYRNRSNLFVLKRKIDYELRELQSQTEKDVEEINDAIEIHRRQFKVPKTDISDFIFIQSHKRKLCELEHTLKRRKGEVGCFEQKTQNLKADHVASLVVLSTGIHRPSKELFLLDADRCGTCNRLYEFDALRHINACTRCSAIKRVLFVVEDKQTDIISFKNQRLPLLPENTPLESITKEHKGSQNRERDYREYLMQFHEDCEPIPEIVKRILYSSFDNIHFLNSLKCKPSSVVAVLKTQEPDIAKYQSYQHKIAKEFNGEPVPELSQVLIDALCVRFAEVAQAASQLTRFGKLPSFEILTHTFLRAERRDDLAIMFFTHKGSIVLRGADVRMRELVFQCAKSTKSDWSFVPRAG
jgi:hypothetical protein